MKNETVEMANPVINTAKLTLSYLATAGVKEAVDFAEKLGYTDFRKQFSSFSGSETDATNAIAQEVRYEFLNRNIKNSGRKNIMDIACGFSPRGLMMAKNGYKYLGLDLAVSVGMLSKVAENCKKDVMTGEFSYSVCDVTNEDSVVENADKFDGEITIVCEGLFMYLSEYEVSSLCNGLKKVLKKHGGAFYTPDFSSKEFYFAVLKSLHGEKKAMEFLLKMGAELKKKSDTALMGLVSPERKDEAIPFFNKHGLKVELIPYFEGKDDLQSFRLVDDDVRTALKENLSKIMVWKVTYDAALDTGKSSKIMDKDFSVSYELSDGLLNVELEGRIDSITAPTFVEIFEKAKSEGEIKKVAIEMKNLSYISSAGLRVLMMMKKHIGTAEIVVSNVCDVVKEIFAQTGFESILTIK